MKNLLLIPIIALMLFSCKNNTDRAMSNSDKQMAIDSMKMVMDKQIVKLEKQKSIDSMKLAMTTKKSATRTQKVNYYKMHANPMADNDAQPQAQMPAAKKKMSSTTKGALIGAGVGAIGGAIIDKKKPWKGALIGGVVGAVAGAGTGAIIDAKKKKKQQQNLAYAY
jgi:hypothetical protein